MPVDAVPISLVRRGRLPPVLLILSLCWSAGAAAAEPPSLDALRTRALELVNEDRRRHDLAPLEAEAALSEAAQRHAEDMLSRGYFAHESPQGETVLDRFVAAGGSRWRKVAENIGRCVECGPATPAGEPGAEDVRRFHEDWMDSETHRANILDPALRSFGFGIAAADDRQYAVQTFAGPGSPPGSESGQAAAESLPPGERADAMLALINDERQNADVPPLQASAALTDAAATLLEELTAGADPDPMQIQGDALYDALPAEQRRRWRELAVIVGVCGGCGVEPTRADLRYFLGAWMEDRRRRARLLDAGLTHFGFALAADGQGRKTALAVFGRRPPL